jgi:hypothetical protein
VEVSRGWVTLLNFGGTLAKLWARKPQAKLPYAPWGVNLHPTPKFVPNRGFMSPLLFNIVDVDVAGVVNAVNIVNVVGVVDFRRPGHQH